MWASGEKYTKNIDTVTTKSVLSTLFDLFNRPDTGDETPKKAHLHATACRTTLLTAGTQRRLIPSACRGARFVPNSSERI